MQFSIRMLRTVLDGKLTLCSRHPAPNSCNWNECERKKMRGRRCMCVWVSLFVCIHCDVYGLRNRRGKFILLDTKSRSHKFRLFALWCWCVPLRSRLFYIQIVKCALEDDSHIFWNWKMTSPIWCSLSHLYVFRFVWLACRPWLNRYWGRK